MITIPGKPIRSVALAALAISTISAYGAERTWNSYAFESGNWSEPTNWDGKVAFVSGSDSALFTGTVSKVQPVVDGKYSTVGIVFQSSGWNIGSSTTTPLTVGANGVSMAASGKNTLNTAIWMGTAQTWTVSDSGGNLVVSQKLGGTGNLTKEGAGKVTLNSGITHDYTGTTTIKAGKFLANGTISASTVEVQAGGVLGGSGTVSQGIKGAGTVNPGDGAGILTTTAINGSAGTDFLFEITRVVAESVSTPTFSSAAASGNDVLRLTSDTPFTLALDAGNTISVDFSAVTLDFGQVYQAGFYVDKGEFFSSIENAQFNFIGVDSGWNIRVSLAQVDANFSGDLASGYMTQFTVVPEPTTNALVGLSLLGLLIAARRRKAARAVA